MKTRIFGYRIVIRMVMVFVLLFALTGCGDDKVKDTTGSGLDASEGMDIYTIYYMNSDWTDFVVKRTNIDQLEATENTIDKLMNLLITSTDDKNCQIPVPMGMTYQRYAYDGQGVVTISRSLMYSITCSRPAAMAKPPPSGMLR